MTYLYGIPLKELFGWLSGNAADHSSPMNSSLDGKEEESKTTLITRITPDSVERVE